MPSSAIPSMFNRWAIDLIQNSSAVYRLLVIKILLSCFWYVLSDERIFSIKSDQNYHHPDEIARKLIITDKSHLIDELNRCFHQNSIGCRSSVEGILMKFLRHLDWRLETFQMSFEWKCILWDEFTIIDFWCFINCRWNVFHWPIYFCYLGKGKLVSRIKISILKTIK